MFSQIFIVLLDIHRGASPYYDLGEDDLLLLIKNLGAAAAGQKAGAFVFRSRRCGRGSQQQQPARLASQPAMGLKLFGMAWQACKE